MNEARKKKVKMKERTKDSSKGRTEKEINKKENN